MSEYLIQQKYLGQAARTVVKNPAGVPQFLLVGSWGPKGNVLSVYSMSGTLLAFVKRVPWSFGTRFDLYQDYQKVGTMNRLFHFTLDLYYIQKLGWHVFGNVEEHQYHIFQFRRQVMAMTSGSFTFGDCYILDIPQVTEAPLAICIASVLDYWLYNTKKDPQKNLKPNLSLD